MNMVFNSMGNFSQIYSNEEICPVCGETYRPAPEHAYRVGNGEGKLVCSYNCQREWEKNPKTFTTKERKWVKVYVKVIETGEIFDSIKDCANRFKTSTTTIHRCMDHGKTYKGFHFERGGRHD